MKPFIYNHPGSEVYPAMEASAMRAGYLLTDEVITSEHACLLMNIVAYSQHASFPSKIEQVLKFLEDEPNEKATVENLIKSYHVLKKIKHRSPKQIGLMKETERVIGEFFKEHIARVEKNFSDLGFTAFKDVIYSGGHAYYRVGDPNRELDIEGYAPSSRLLRRMTEIENEVDREILFFLTDEVFRLCFSAEQPWLAPDDAAAAMPGQSWFEAFATMPNINNLTGHELKAIRHELREPGAAFRETCDRWIADSYSENYPGTGLDYFKASVRPAAQALGKAITNNAILTAHAQSANNQLPVTLWLGEMPAHQIWDYYEKIGIAQPATAAILKPLRSEPAYSQRWPVMVLQVGDARHLPLPPASEENDDGADNESGLLSRRKTINID